MWGGAIKNNKDGSVANDSHCSPREPDPSTHLHLDPTPRTLVQGIQNSLLIASAIAFVYTNTQTYTHTDNWFLKIKNNKDTPAG